MTKRTFNHGDDEARKRKAYERLGTDSPKCFFCDITDPEILELHHIAGREFGDDGIFTCRNHHGLLSSLGKNHPPKIPGPSDPLENLAHFLLGVADVLKVLMDQLRNAAAKLIEYVKFRSTGSDAEAGQ